MTAPKSSCHALFPSYTPNTIPLTPSDRLVSTPTFTPTAPPYPSRSPPTPSPPPTPASPPPEQTESADTSQNCKCSCCTGNYCSASLVASYDAESSSDCGVDDCRSRFSTLCPASGESGRISASYSSEFSTSDARSIKVMHSLAAVGIWLILAY